MRNEFMGREEAIVERGAGQSRAAAAIGALRKSGLISVPASFAYDVAENLDQCLEAQEIERRKLVQDLHDSTGHLFLGLTMEIGRLRKQAGFEAASEMI